MNKILLLLIALVLIGGFIFWLFTNLSKSGKQSGPITLTVRGFNDEQAEQPILQQYEASHPNVKISYTKESLINYRTRVQTQIREGAGPDVFLIHNSWLPMFTADLTPAPADILNPDELKSYLPLVADSLAPNNQIYGLPINLDGLVLYYNEDILASAGVSVPKSWREFVEAATKMTVKDTSGQIKTAGAALGSTKNVDYWPEIIGLLMLQQPGVNINNPGNSQASEVLKFYTSFIIEPTQKTWDVNLPNDSEMFVGGKLAFYFGDFSKINDFQTKNPNLKFKVAPVPQLPTAPMAWGDFWAEAVSAKSAHPKEAWELVKYLASKEVVAGSGQPSARIDLADQQVQDPNLAAFITQGPYAKSWYLNHLTQDSGLNDEMIAAWQNPVESVLTGLNPDQAAGNLAGATKQVLDKYGIK